MNAFSFQSERRRSAHQQGDRDHYLSCDTEPPNHQAHRRGFMAILVMIGVAAALAVVATTLQGLTDMKAAFPDTAALLQGASWDRFFAGFGRVSVLLLAVTLAVLIVRWRRRKARAAAPAAMKK